MKEQANVAQGVPNPDRAYVMLTAEISQVNSCEESTKPEQNFDDDLKNVYLGDTGATAHMFRDKENFMEIDQTRQFLVTVADGRTVQCQGVGRSQVRARNAEGETCIIEFEDALYMPGLHTNLFSVTAAVQKDELLTVTTTAKGLSVTKNGKEIAFGHYRSDQKLYIMDFEPIRGRDPLTAEESEHALLMRTPGADYETWHARLGHPSMKIMKMVKDNSVGAKTLKFPEKDELCEICVQGKLNEEPFTASNTKVDSPLSLVVSDIFGPYPIATLGSGAQYFVTYIDVFTQTTKVYLLRYKEQQPVAFEMFLKWCRKTFGDQFQIRTFRSDNGGEYTSKRFQSRLEQLGITHQTTIARQSGQNGIAERKNRAIADGVALRLAESGRSQGFWGEALYHWEYTDFRLPRQGLKGKTSYEMCHDQVPDISRLRVFGCRVFYYVTPEKRHKFQPRARVGYLMGYADEANGKKAY